ncbi:MAG: DUF6125 family protein [Candidatus Thorarchaeota archaeon]
MLGLYEDLPKDTLLKIIDTYAKAWQAMDGAYFLALEKKFGMDIAIEMDKEAWRIFSPIEAKRIMREFDIPENGGLKALEKALGFRVYATLNKQSTKWAVENKLIFTMEACRVQVARNRKGLPDFPCKQVGLIEYEEFAKTIDPRIKTSCRFCPPDDHPDSAYCQWEFTLEE